MYENSNNRLEQQLLDIFSRYAERVPFRQWADEEDRWRELVVCLLFTHGGEARGRSREAADLLQNLNLLDIEDLAAIPVKNNQPDWRRAQVALMRDVLDRLGFLDADITAALHQILKMARLVRNNYGGKIQMYLRHYGRLMLKNFEKDFPGGPSPRNRSRRIPPDRRKDAFVMWLQNSLAMPVFLDTPNIRRFCREMKCTPEELHRAADSLNINASVTDDLIDLWALEEDV